MLYQCFRPRHSAIRIFPIVLDGYSQVQPASIVIIDLLTDKIIKKFFLKASDVREASNLASITIDVTSRTCDDAYAYIPDLGGYGLIVYSLKKDESYRVAHNYFYLENNRGDFYVGGVKFQWNDGIFSIALSDVGSDSYRTAYFHSLAGTKVYSVSTKILKDKRLATRSYHDNDFKVCFLYVSGFPFTLLAYYILMLSLFQAYDVNHAPSNVLPLPAIPLGCPFNTQIINAICIWLCDLRS